MIELFPLRYEAVPATIENTPVGARVRKVCCKLDGANDAYNIGKEGEVVEVVTSYRGGLHGGILKVRYEGENGAHSEWRDELEVVE